MSAGFPTITLGSAGSTQSSTGSVTCAVNVAVENWYLGLVCVYAKGNLLATIDAGDGWLILARGYSPTNTYGMLLAGYMGGRKSTGDWLGMTFPSSMAYGSSARPLIIPQPFQFGLGNAKPCDNYWSATASGTGNTYPYVSPCYSQVVDVGICGAACGAQSVSWTPPTGFTNMVVGYATSATAGVVMIMDYRVVTGNVSNYPSVSGTMNRSLTNRMGLRCTIPILGETSHLYQLNAGRIS